MMPSFARTAEVIGVAFGLLVFLLLLVSGFPGSAPAIEGAPPLQDGTPHPVEGRGDCLACHGAGSAKPVPPSHTGRPNTTCLACHPAVPAAPVDAPPRPSPENPAPSAPPQSFAVQGDAECMACHAQPLDLTFANGQKLSLRVDADAFGSSVHGGKLGCGDCHANISQVPHAKTRATSLREYVTAQYEVCKRCHFANYTKTLDSVHYQVMSTGERNAPVCTDCHSAHTVAQPNEPRIKISEACGRCHVQVYADYRTSVHGSALRAEDNKDVPDCTTCHGVHDIYSATSASFHLSSTDLCASCHSDEKMMDKYGISANVLQTYLDDFHGRTVNFARQEARTIWTDKPVCVDCHGVHDIKKANDPESPTIKANLLQTCQKCHPTATANFSAAWLSHYEPSLQKSPIVYLVKVYYWALIPMMIGGLVLHILLDLWRLARNR